MKRGFTLLRDLFLNFFLNYRYDLFFVVDNYNWVIDCEWKSVSDHLNMSRVVRSRITSTHYGLRGRVIHFGSVNSLVTKDGLKWVSKSNRVVLTWFHIVPDDPRFKFVKEINRRVSFIHTACLITKNKLLQFGIDASKIVIVPLGIELNLFKLGNQDSKSRFKEMLGISKEDVVIGSFQKDGIGWGKGDSPKLIKGPDIFCDVVDKLAQKYPIHVLLTGPARGYVINRLNKSGIRYTHAYLENFKDIVPYYQILDLYLICSREEGGPKALLESMACGVPLVSTKVGMAPDIIVNEENASLVEVGDTHGLSAMAAGLIDDQAKRAQFIRQASETVKVYDFSLVSRLYWDKIYTKLII